MYMRLLAGLWGSAEWDAGSNRAKPRREWIWGGQAPTVTSKATVTQSAGWPRWEAPSCVGARSPRRARPPARPHITARNPACPANPCEVSVASPSYTSPPPSRGFGYRDALGSPPGHPLGPEAGAASGSPYCQRSRKPHLLGLRPAPSAAADGVYGLVDCTSPVARMESGIVPRSFCITSALGRARQPAASGSGRNVRMPGGDRAAH
jgi:hypothetical protein